MRVSSPKSARPYDKCSIRTLYFDLTLLRKRMLRFAEAVVRGDVKSMRKTIGAGLMWTGFAAAFAATGYYIYFMWGLDWGPMMTRGHNLMLVLMLFGSIIVFVAVLAVFGFLATTIDKDLGS